ncbi:MAG: hypothetical protein FJZ56_03850 [Chlamydiae bacterium]|nr:hypothetical protein [Chlamydiota bacterium]
MNAEFEEVPKKKFEDLSSQAFLNRFLSIICTVAFAIIGVGAMAVTAIFAPIALPFVLLGVLATIPLIKQYVYDYFESQRTIALDSSDVQKKVLDELSLLENQTEEELDQFIDELGLDKEAYHANPDKFKAVAAEYKGALSALEQALESSNIEMTRVDEAIAREIDNETQATHSGQPFSCQKRMNLIEAHAEREAHEYKITEVKLLALKVKAAWYLHLLRNTHYPRSCNEEIFMYKIHAMHRSLNSSTSNRLPNHLRDPYLGLENGEILSRKAVYQLSIDDLSYVFSRGAYAVERVFQNSLAAQDNQLYLVDQDELDLIA